MNSGSTVDYDFSYKLKSTVDYESTLISKIYKYICSLSNSSSIPCSVCYDSTLTWLKPPFSTSICSLCSPNRHVIALNMLSEFNISTVLNANALLNLDTTKADGFASIVLQRCKYHCSATLQSFVSTFINFAQFGFMVN